MKSQGGRNNMGHVTMRYKGGGHKRMYRKIDWKRNKFGIPAKVSEIEYDPNRSARIALLVYADGEKRYILHPKGLKQGDTVVSGPGADARNGNALPLGEIPLGTSVHCVELKIGKGGQMARTAGASAQVVAREGEYVTLRLRSSEMRMVHSRCLATIGEVGNSEHELLSIGQGRQEPLAGQALEGPRRRQEPGGSPAGRRRRQELGRPAAGVALGQARGPQDPAAEEGVEPVRGARPQARQGDAVVGRRRNDRDRTWHAASRRARSFRSRCS